MPRLFRRRWNWSTWLALGLLVWIAIRFCFAPAAILTFVPEGMVQVLRVEEGPVLVVSALKPTGETGAEVYRVCLIGISANASTATAYLREQYVGKTVRVELDKRRLHANGTCLVYLYAGRTFINAELIHRKLANYAPYLGDSSRHAKELKEAEKQSLAESRSAN